MGARSLRGEYRETGMVKQCFELANTGLVAKLAQELPLYDAEAQRLAERDIRSVPYLITPAVRDLVLDRTLVGIAEAVLGGPVVLWGANIRRGVPNAAHLWHVDAESRFWPSATVVVGLGDCNPTNSTWYLPGSQNIGRPPPSQVPANRHDEILGIAHDLEPRCKPASQFGDFGNGRFFVFDAGGWHAGDPDVGSGRTLLFAHFNLITNPRVPLMRDYQKDLWHSRAAPFVECPPVTRVGRRTLRRKPRLNTLVATKQ